MTLKQDTAPADCSREPLLVFLDFEDVMYPTIREVREQGAWRAGPHDGPMANAVLEDILAPYLDRVEIVLTTRWAYWHGIERARSMLSPSLTECVVDSVWLAELITPTWSDYNSKLATSYACIQLWFKRRRPAHAGPWLAVAAHASDWPEALADHLFWAGGTLWHPLTQQRLRDRLQTLLDSGERNHDASE
jgi:hypothetical protein